MFHVAAISQSEPGPFGVCAFAEYESFRPPRRVCRRWIAPLGRRTSECWRGGLVGWWAGWQTGDMDDVDGRMSVEDLDRSGAVCTSKTFTTTMSGPCRRLYRLLPRERWRRVLNPGLFPACKQAKSATRARHLPHLLDRANSRLLVLPFANRLFDG